MKRILILLPNNLGDVIMAIPVLYGLKRDDPECHISFLVEDGFEGGLENLPVCDRIYRFHRKKFREYATVSSWSKGVDALLAVAKILHNEKFDLVINYAQHPYLSSFSSLIDAPASLGAIMRREGCRAIDDVWSQYLFAIPFARKFNRLHATDVYKRIAGVRGPVASSIVLTDSEKKAATNFLISQSIKHYEKLVFFQPGAAFKSKKWLPEYFIELGKMLVSDGYTICISGAPSECDIVKQISDGLSGACVSLAGKLTFRETVGVLSFSSLLVTGDTALMHAASSLNVKTIALFSSTSPVETGPYGNEHLIVCGKCEQRPCFKTECSLMNCMKRITPQIIYDLIVKSKSKPIGDYDLYRTSINKNGDYQLVSDTGSGIDYFTADGAAITLNALGSDDVYYKTDLINITYRDESLQVISFLDKMIHEVDTYELTGTINALSNFEMLKQELTTIREIGEWWSAILNIRLNSIPLLDFNSAIKKSRDVCMMTKAEILNGIAQ
jgi:ADP-heptose:LPS heptosyltransferase